MRRATGVGAPRRTRAARPANGIARATERGEGADRDLAGAPRRGTAPTQRFESQGPRQGSRDARGSSLRGESSRPRKDGKTRMTSNICVAGAPARPRTRTLPVRAGSFTARGLSTKKHDKRWKRGHRTARTGISAVPGDATRGKHVVPPAPLGFELPAPSAMFRSLSSNSRDAWLGTTRPRSQRSTLALVGSSSAPVNGCPVAKHC